MPGTRFSQPAALLLVLLSLVCALQAGTTSGETPLADAATGAASPPTQATIGAHDAPTGEASGESAQKLTEALEALRDLSAKGRYAECEAGARKLLAKVEAATGPDSRETSQVLEILVMSLWRGGKASASETLELAQRALRITEAQFGPDSLETARAANNLGNVCFRAGDLAATRLQWERVLAIREKVLGPEHADVGAALNNLAVLAEQTGEFLRSRDLAERSVAIREKSLGPDHRDVATSLNTLGTALGRLGDFDGEMRAQERALGIWEKTVGPDHPFVANVLEALCKTEMDRFELGAAKTRCTQTLAVRQKTLGPDHPDVAMGLDNLAYVLLETGDPVAAVELLERALAIQEKTLGPEHADVAYTLEYLALAQSRLDRPEKAKQLYRRALELEEKAGALHPRVAEVLLSLGRVYVSQGDDDAAQPLFERALKTIEATQSADFLTVSDYLIDLGSLQVRSGNLDGAEQLFNRAMVIREKYYGPGHYAVALVLLRMIPVDRARGDVPSLLSHSLRAAGILREHFRRVAQGLSEREAMKYRENLDSGLNDALAALAADPGRTPSPAPLILDELIRSRAMVLDEMGSRHRIASQGLAPGSANLVEALRASRTRLARLLVRGPSDQPGQYRRRLEEAEKDEERAERELAAASVAFRSEREQDRAGLAEVRGALPPSSALVAFVKYDLPFSPMSGASKTSSSAAYLAFVIRSDNGGIPVVSFGEATRIESLVESWRQALHPPEALDLSGGKSEARYREVAARLRQAVWDPVAPHLAGSKQVFIVPDGSLNLVSLAALPAGSNRYLVETGPTLHHVSAERDLLQPPRADAGHGLLAMGGPDFDADPRGPSPGPSPDASRGAPKPGARTGSVYRGPPPACAEFRTLRFAPLPGAEAEVSEIDRLWLKATPRGAARGTALILTGAAASEAAFKQNSASFRIVHLATHGFFLPDRCESAPSSRAAAPVPDSGSTSARLPSLTDSPLLLSGLALAGANRREEAGTESEVEDGILTSDEIASLSLPGVEWLVLSGCDTGAGRVLSGEGVQGLRRAFQVAGARTLIMSLWKVEDAAAADWMRRLYEARGKGLSTAEAMRRASRGALQARRAKGRSAHPYYWGPFIAAGDWK